MSFGEQKPRQVMSVSGLLEAARSVLETDIGPVWMEAEVFEYRGPHRGSGHYYFKLRDSEASVSAIMWRGVAARALKGDIKEGQQVLVRGRFDIYSARGTLSFVLDHVENVGAGDLSARFEQLKKQLHGEGLFDAERKQELPERPKRVVVITGRDSAAEADILRTFEDGGAPIHILMSHVRVQGEGAAGEIVVALDQAARIKPDLILLSRGGGSLEDLWAFNEESLVRAIAACPVPVMSAVGHEVDFTLSDFVADARAITPTDGAQQISSSWIDARQQTQALAEDLPAAIKRLMREKHFQLNRAMRAFLAQAPGRRVERARVRFGHAEQALCSAAQKSVAKSHERLQRSARRLLHAGPQQRLQQVAGRLDKALAQLDAGDPRALLARGYALVQVEGESAFVRDPAQVEAGTLLAIQLAAGKLGARVE
ncbi:MAG: exodeoxyribonuclease VII large subunit [Planctomycetes bacterium]|nr:exodeoxyribonuclease VII large subunit [Planctomycetota bacterium]MCP4771825.1 exodeoxyribonuclease VII large subunit [Planctomycetota bacterium]MCP4860930.1 exodeoxyribonuclease VII large subunit [Planctomycetota bacterium]